MIGNVKTNLRKTRNSKTHLEVIYDYAFGLPCVLIKNAHLSSELASARDKNIWVFSQRGIEDGIIDLVNDALIFILKISLFRRKS